MLTAVCWRRGGPLQVVGAVVVVVVVVVVMPSVEVSAAVPRGRGCEYFISLSARGGGRTRASVSSQRCRAAPCPQCTGRQG